MIDHLNKARFFSIDKTWAYIDIRSPSIEEIMVNLLDVKEDTILKKRLAMVKYKDKGQSFDRYKVRMELICDGCNYRRCFYSNKMVGGKGGPKKSDVEELGRWSEGGYMCGSNNA